jgi:hypothetical protein
MAHRTKEPVTLGESKEKSMIVSNLFWKKLMASARLTPN